MYDPINYITPSSIRRVARHHGLAIYELNMRRLRGAMPQSIREQQLLVAHLGYILIKAQPRQARLFGFNYFPRRARIETVYSSAIGR